LISCLVPDDDDEYDDDDDDDDNDDDMDALSANFATWKRCGMPAARDLAVLNINMRQTDRVDCENPNSLHLKTIGWTTLFSTQAVS